jgi:hypothetical protein
LFCFVILQLCFDTQLTHTQVLGHFLSSTHSTLAFCYPLEKDPAVFGFNTRVLEWGEIWEGLERLTAVSIPASKCHRNWHKACICTITEKEEKKDLFWFCWLFFLASAFAQVFS